MSQYTTSIKAMIELDAYKDGFKPYELRIDDYITRGRKLVFNFNYVGDTLFKEYFEKRFISKYLLENINNEYPPLWLKHVESIVQISAPLYYLKYQGLNQLTIDKMLSDGIRVTEINKDGTTDSEADSTSNTNSASTTNNRDTISDTSSHKKTGTVTSVFEDDSTDRTTTEATSSGSGSGSTTNTNSAFPFNVATTTSVNAVAYKTDGGKVESSNSASNTDSSSSQTIHADDNTRTDTYNTTDTDTDTRTDAFTGASDSSTVNTKSDTKNDTFKEHEKINEQLTGNLLDKVMKLYNIDFNPIEAFIDELYNKLFMLIW